MEQLPDVVIVSTCCTLLQGFTLNYLGYLASERYTHQRYAVDFFAGG